jgi:hypothetical protein
MTMQSLYTYTKVTCEFCKGTGRLSMKEGYHTIGADRRRKPRCHHCHGFGWNEIGTRIESISHEQ